MFTDTVASKVSAAHLAKPALLYVRPATLKQVIQPLRVRAPPVRPAAPGDRARGADAVAVLERALDNAEGSPSRRIRTLISLAFTQRMIRRFEESRVSSNRAVAAAEELGDPALISRALAMSVQLHFVYGHGIDEAKLNRAVELEGAPGDVLNPFPASLVDGMILGWTGRLAEARTKMEAFRLRSVERGAEHDLMAVASCCTLIEVWRGNFADAAQLADDAVERAEQGGGSHATALSLRAMAAAYLRRQDRARADIQAALDVADRGNSPRLPEWPLMTLGCLEVSLGNYEEALKAVQPQGSGVVD